MGRVCCGDLGLEKRTKHEYHAAMFAELCATSNFTFLTGASHPEELVARAMVLGLPAVAIADVNCIGHCARPYKRPHIGAGIARWPPRTIARAAGPAPAACGIVGLCRRCGPDGPAAKPAGLGQPVPIA